MNQYIQLILETYSRRICHWTRNDLDFAINTCVEAEKIFDGTCNAQSNAENVVVSDCIIRLEDAKKNGFVTYFITRFLNSPFMKDVPLKLYSELIDLLSNSSYANIHFQPTYVIPMISSLIQVHSIHVDVEKVHSVFSSKANMDTILIDHYIDLRSAASNLVNCILSNMTSGVGEQVLRSLSQSLIHQCAKDVDCLSIVFLSCGLAAEKVNALGSNNINNISCDVGESLFDYLLFIIRFVCEDLVWNPVSSVYEPSVEYISTSLYSVPHEVLCEAMSHSVLVAQLVIDHLRKHIEFLKENISLSPQSTNPLSPSSLLSKLRDFFYAISNSTGNNSFLQEISFLNIKKDGNILKCIMNLLDLCT